MSISDQFVPIPVPDRLQARVLGTDVRAWFAPIAMFLHQSDPDEPETISLAVMDMYGTNHRVYDEDINQRVELRWWSEAVAEEDA